MRLRESLNLRSNYFCRSIIFMYLNKIEILTYIIFNRHKFFSFFFFWLVISERRNDVWHCDPPTVRVNDCIPAVTND